MDDFEKLIEAAKCGNVAEVKAIVTAHAELINQKDQLGATAMHYAAFDGHREVVEVLVEHGADVNAIDTRFSATPAGWAIEYLREMGGLLGIELRDFGYAIERGEVEWVVRFLARFPRLRGASDPQGKPFRLLAQESGNPEIVRLFDASV